MFINAVPVEFTAAGEVYLPAYVTAPLGLAKHIPFWVAFYQRHNQAPREALITPYPVDTWSDMWRLEVHMWDQRGQLARMLRFFDGQSIRVLHFTSRDSFASQWHVKYFMLDLRRYVSSIDLNTVARRKPQFVLRGLKWEFLSEFFKHVRISSDGKPWITISRNLVHHDMHLARTSLAQQNGDWVGRSFHFRSEPQHFGKQRTLDLVSLAPRSWQLNPKDCYPVLSTNVKSQVIYCTFAAKAGYSLEHVQFFVAFEKRRVEGDEHESLHQSERLLLDLFEDLAEGRFNIVRSQCKSGALGLQSSDLDQESKKEVLSWLSDEKLQVFTVNLMVTSDGPSHNIFDQVKERVRLRIRSRHLNILTTRLPRKQAPGRIGEIKDGKSETHERNNF